MLREPGQLRLDRRENARDLVRRPLEIVGREHPEADRADPDLGAPLQHLVELLGAQRVRLAQIGHAALERVATVTVKDDAEEAGDVAGSNLLEETPPVEVVEEAPHRQNFTLAPPSRASQENRERGSPVFYGRELTAFRNSWICAAFEVVPAVRVGSV